MLPLIGLGIGIIAVGAYLLDDAKSENESARREYEDTADASIKKVQKAAYAAQKKDALDKLFKIKKAKRKVADSIYRQLQSSRKEIGVINSNLKRYKDTLAQLFDQKKAAVQRVQKRQIQEEINKVIVLRKELFATKDEMITQQKELQTRLKTANQETRSVQNQINKILREKDMDEKATLTLFA